MYFNIVKLILPNREKEKEPEIVNKPAELWNKMAENFQEIFNKQQIENNPNCIDDFYWRTMTQNPLMNFSTDSCQKNLNGN